jgi:hypothetical protein
VRRIGPQKVLDDAIAEHGEDAVMMIVCVGKALYLGWREPVGSAAG